MEPIIEYGSTVWDPHLHKNINKIQKFKDDQLGLLKMIIRGSYLSVISLINDLEWQSLQSRRATLKVMMMYKIIHRLALISSHPKQQ